MVKTEKLPYLVKESFYILELLYRTQTWTCGNVLSLLFAFKNWNYWQLEIVCFCAWANTERNNNSVLMKYDTKLWILKLGNIKVGFLNFHSGFSKYISIWGHWQIHSSNFLGIKVLFTCLEKNGIWKRFFILGPR